MDIHVIALKYTVERSVEQVNATSYKMSDQLMHQSKLIMTFFNKFFHENSFVGIMNNFAISLFKCHPHNFPSYEYIV